MVDVLLVGLVLKCVLYVFGIWFLLGVLVFSVLGGLKVKRSGLIFAFIVFALLSVLLLLLLYLNPVWLVDVFKIGG